MSPAKEIESSSELVKSLVASFEKLDVNGVDSTVMSDFLGLRAALDKLLARQPAQEPTMSPL